MLSARQPELRHSQNFLKDPALVASLLGRTSIGPDDLVYEIGPGKGIITAQLARQCGRVIAIEKDARLCARLQRQFRDCPNVTIYAEDFLCHPLPSRPYKVFANIPFNLTSAILHRLTDSSHPPEDAYLALQQEAVDMLLGCPHESLRSILLKPWFDLSLVHRFRRADFAPQPGVDVALIRMCKRRFPQVQAAYRQCFRDFAVHCFTAWQPALTATLRRMFTRQQLKRVSTELGIDQDATPTQLSFEQWLGLFKAFLAFGSPQAVQAIAGCEQRLLGQQARLTKQHRTRARKAGIRQREGKKT